MQSRLSVLCALLTLPALAACQVAKEDKAEAQAAPDSTVAASVSAATPDTQGAPAAHTTTAVPTESRSVAVNVQGTAAIGATVRVKSVELGTDATLVSISASYGGTMTRDIKLAGSATYLMDEQGNKLMLKPPQDNPDLLIAKGQMMDGQLVFLGAVPPGTKTVKLVFNDNNDGDSIIDPGLTIAVPLDGAGK